MPEAVGDDPLRTIATWAAPPASTTATAPDGAAPPVLMALATAGADGAPHNRTVVVTSIDGVGLRFHSSTPTAKSRDLHENPRASGVLLWPDAGRQAVVSGAVVQLDAATSARAYLTRPRQLRLLAWVYEDLGQDLADPWADVPEDVVQAGMRAAVGREDTAPPSWTTFALVPDRVELWRAGSELVAAARTRFLRDGERWVRRGALP
ncbi:pyridoxamine 5'-phosphate oxidase family protein [Litorihabitans aurantiacus]|uniref:Pyridoxamine 5'-phosphate oxidase N-terminal domain-containing protein n=1 Tax=Litorihabitans aurantiacus TaxID=1930061 RepID=A0AA37UI67_9MICO|nr:pyridoxamine 5'-phosphate oxidase family protein [Litorihabitans aurantiacus]GMA31029.1 hypothetical protein GCM10025875_10210 [Litorihabitans aurantiacus]